MSWPLLAPGPLTFDLFEIRMASWLGAVLSGTGIAGLRDRLRGVQPRPYIIRFTEDRPNPLYRRICYTLAWSGVIAFAILNIAGLVFAVATGQWRLRQMYDAARSTQGEGPERRYFYGSVWAVCIAQSVLWLLWKLLPRSVLLFPARWRSPTEESNR